MPQGAELLTDASWQEKLDPLPSYSFFAAPAWARILNDAELGMRAQALEFNLDGGRALLPLVWRRDMIGNAVCQSSAYGTYGGLIPLSDQQSESAGAGAAVQSRLLAAPNFGLLVAYPGPRPHISFPKVFARFSAHVIDTSTESASGLLEAMRSKTRQYIRKAERAGVRVDQSRSSADFATYYAMLEASARRWGRRNPGKPWSIFDSIQRNTTDEAARLWMARVGDEPAAGLLCFYGKGEAFAWSAALDDRLADSRANYLLHWHAIADAANRGYDIFSLGASEGLAGVSWFKEGLGAHPVEYPAYVVAGPVYRTAFRILTAALRARGRLTAKRRAPHDG